MKQILLLSTILIFAASCVSNPETSSLASNEQDEKDGRICKQEQVLGSKIPQKICYTKAEIEDMEEVDKMPSKMKDEGEWINKLNKAFAILVSQYSFN